MKQTGPTNGGLLPGGKTDATRTFPSLCDISNPVATTAVTATAAFFWPGVIDAHPDNTQHRINRDFFMRQR